MKIKYVCEATELSDRTIRYYIEEELIFPSYTENYLGRRTYDFSEKDIEELNQIAILRKFGFTVEEIRSLVHQTEISSRIIQNLKERTEASVKDKEKILSTLSQINCDKDYTLCELAAELKNASSDMPKHKEKIKHNIPNMMLKIFGTVVRSIIVWLPLVIVAWKFSTKYSYYSYPIINCEAVLWTFVSLLPSVIILIISKFRFRFKNALTVVLLVLCILGIPFNYLCAVSIVSHSETTNFQFYRDFDSNCLADRDLLFQELFPAWPRYFENVKQSDGTIEAVYLDAHYYYRYLQSFDYTYDIYAEWPLEPEEYEKEVERVNKLFGEREHITIKKGDFDCLIVHSGTEPFKKATDNYYYLIFAYNDKTKTVRYICCDSMENGADQPYYLELEW